jgi:hypothetical protein
MPFSNWLHHVAVRGCLIAIFIFCCSALHAQENNSQQQPEAAPTNSTQENSAQNSPLPGEREQTVKTDWGNPECGQAQSHDEADLCEQRRMAKAAEDAVLLSKIQIALGIAGAGLLLWTLYYSRRATEAAIVAADAATDSASATREANLLTQHHAEKELRAYVLIQGADIREEGNEILGRVDFQNFGPTPGYDFETHLNMGIDVPSGSPYNESPAREKSKSIIGPGAVLKSSTNTIILNEREFEEIYYGQKVIFVWGYVRYKDAFGKRWKFIFACTNSHRAVRNLKDSLGNPTGRGWGLAPHPQFAYEEKEDTDN